tara:strand:- start:1980 stop:2654 length:675 start_codon:yes stop_codon:yes gene_type:complete
MELTEKTLSVLKNYATINPNIVVQPGKIVRTIATAKNVMSTATVDNEFTQAFGIYDLNEFLSVVSLVDSPRLKFEDTHVLIGDSSGRSRVKYYFSDTELLTTITKEVTMPEAEVKFRLDNNTLGKVLKAANALGHSEICVSVVDSVLNISVVDVKNTTSNLYSIDIDGEYTSDKFKFYILKDNLKLLPGNYTVEMSSKNISRFYNAESSVEYFVALEKHSTFGE